MAITKTPLQVTINKQLRQDIEEMAKNDNRSLSSMVETLLLRQMGVEKYK